MGVMGVRVGPPTGWSISVCQNSPGKNEKKTKNKKQGLCHLMH